MALGDLLGDPVGGKEQSCLRERSFQTQRTLSGSLWHDHFDKRDKELECLRRLARDLELEARGRCWRRDHKECTKGSTSVRGGYGKVSHQSDSHQHQDWSREYID